MKRSFAFASCAFVLGAFAFGCSNSVLTVALGEPLALEGGQFLSGELPGTPPKEGQARKKPYAISYSSYRTYFRPGALGISFSGKVTSDATSVGVRLKDEGSGYFVVPAGFEDPSDDSFLDGSFSFDLHDVEPGLHTVQVAAIDADGKSGTQFESEFCVSPFFEDHGNSCDPTQAPPALIVALEWDAPVDLDLRVVTPDGVVVDSKNPSTLAPGEEPGADSPGLIDIDSFRGCLPDGAQREHLVFEGKPRTGNYNVYVNLFDACGEQSVNYRVKLYTRVAGEKPGTFALKEKNKGDGTLVAVQQKPDSGVGTWVTDITVK